MECLQQNVFIKYFGIVETGRIQALTIAGQLSKLDKPLSLSFFENHRASEENASRLNP